jgi:hypothetical protein
MSKEFVGILYQKKKEFVGINNDTVQNSNIKKIMVDASLTPCYCFIL